MNEKVFDIEINIITCIFFCFNKTLWSSQNENNYRKINFFINKKSFVKFKKNKNSSTLNGIFRPLYYIIIFLTLYRRRFSAKGKFIDKNQNQKKTHTRFSQDY